jgi:AraC-like DNA-binding protein
MVANLVFDYIERNYKDPIGLRDVAAAMGYSPCHLTTIFREATGTPVHSWIVKRRIRAARELLCDKHANLADVCAAVGFGDVGYFRRQFVRHVGLTPARFRDGDREVS